MLTEAELVAFADAHTTRSAFRLEVRDRYTVASDAGNFRRYLAGESAPSMAVKGPWLERIARERAAGVRRYRVHIVRPPLSDYLRYECEWGYVHTAAAGEEIYILDVGDLQAPIDLPDQDFWLFDDEHVVLMHYDDEGRFSCAELLPPEETPRYRSQRDVTLASAEPFPRYWAAHPEYWRDNSGRRAGGAGSAI